MLYKMLVLVGMAQRAIAGLGAAGIFSGALIIIANITPLEKRAAYQGMLGGMYGIASVVGPLIGGAFTDNVTWRWCFYINLPIGGVTAAAVVLALRLPPASMFKNLGFRKSAWQLDPVGTVLFVPSIICLLLALKWGGTTYAWSTGRIIALLVIFAVTIMSFVGVQGWMKDSGTVSSSTGRWVGYQILYGFGCGCAFQLPQIAAQAVLAPPDVPIGVAVTLFATMLGGSIFVSAANNVLNNGLIKYIGNLNIPGVDPHNIVNIGATQFRSYIPQQYLPQAVEAYNTAVSETFRIALIISCLSAVGAAGMQWKSLKQGGTS
ncbi:hypothetical protein MMC20_001976 [Loxospora ochrophaea]|nr:hypothetical protein [Loxospora ochrophaea]